MPRKHHPVVPEARPALNALKEQIRQELFKTHHPYSQRFRDVAEQHAKTPGVTKTSSKPRPSH